MRYISRNISYFQSVLLPYVNCIYYSIHYDLRVCIICSRDKFDAFPAYAINRKEYLLLLNWRINNNSNTSYIIYQIIPSIASVYSQFPYTFMYMESRI